MNSLINHRKNFKSGEIISFIGKKTAKVIYKFYKYFPKFKRYNIINKKILVHIPEELETKLVIGDIIKYASCRKLSTLKSNIIVRKNEE